MVGRVVQEGELIARVDELSTVEVETPISEKDIADVAIGQPVALKARAYPGKTFFGTVTSIGTTINDAAGGAGDARATSGNVAATGGPPGPKTVLVTTRITNPDLLLKPGMTGMIKISCGKRRIVDLVLRRIARTVRVEFWSWW